MVRYILKKRMADFFEKYPLCRKETEKEERYPLRESCSNFSPVLQGRCGSDIVWVSR